MRVCERLGVPFPGPQPAAPDATTVVAPASKPPQSSQPPSEAVAVKPSSPRTLSGHAPNMSVDTVEAPPVPPTPPVPDIPKDLAPSAPVQIEASQAEPVDARESKPSPVVEPKPAPPSDILPASNSVPLVPELDVDAIPQPKPEIVPESMPIVDSTPKAEFLLAEKPSSSLQPVSTEVQLPGMEPTKDMAMEIEGQEKAP